MTTTFIDLWLLAFPLLALDPGHDITIDHASDWQGV